MPPKVNTEMRVWVALDYHTTKNAAQTIRNFQLHFPNSPPPSDKTVKNIYEKLVATGSVMDQYKGHAGRPTSVITDDNVAAVDKFFKKTKQPTIRKCAAKLNLAPTTVWRILHKELDFKAYKVSINQLLKESDIAARMTFEAEMREKLETGVININKIWFSDEAHFYLHGFVNRQNYRIWGTENPHFVVERPLHPEYLTVWMGISGSGLIGPFFFYDTVTGERYKTMLENDFFPAARTKCQIDGFWFQQDGATPHRTTEVKDCIRSVFDDRIIALGFTSEEGGEIAWPPHSPDLNPCDFALWGMMKDHVYKNQPNNLFELKSAIENFVQTLSPDTLVKIMANFLKRLDLIPLMEGAHFENVIN